MRSFLTRIYAKLLRTLYSLFRQRPDSHPYLSGDGLRTIADHVYDETGKCDPTKISHGDVVFLKTDLIEEWFVNVHPMIKNPYKLITHNSDHVVGEKEASFIDDKIIRWYAQNNVFAHEKIVPIPIGIENKKWFMSGWILQRKAETLRSSSVSRKNRILYGFNTSTNVEERTGALNSLNKTAVADGITKRIYPAEYFKTLNTYKFVASPEGNGPDCIRTWEAIIIGVIPIVRNASNCPIFNDENVPVWIINDWSELETLTEVDLENIYESYAPKLKSDITKLDYWIKRIKENE